VRLSQQAQEILEKLKNEDIETSSDLEELGYDQSMIERSVKELEEKGLVKSSVEEAETFEITGKGETVRREGSPEFRLVDELSNGPKEFSDLKVPADVAVGKAKEKGWIEIQEGEVSLTEVGEEADEDPLRQELQEENFTEKHLDRGLVRKEIESEKIVELTDKGERIDLENVKDNFNVEARAETPRTGKKHFFKSVKDYAKQVWLEMGFKEMRGDFITPGITCFDALYIPQDHPAQDLQDTFYMDNPERTDLGELLGDYVGQIKDVHESGGDTGSEGWQYDWSEDLAGKNILRTHTTDVSAKKLMELEEEDLPAKYFIISHAFRNETVDRTHTADFEQAEGIVVGEDLGFAHLKGYLSEFFEKMGYDEFRLIPTYYPYTEMSTEIQVWDEEEEEWLGMGGAGLFRPEVVKPLLGVEATVLAWGLGIARIGAMAAGITDARNIYRNDIENLQEIPVWRP
jgi:phenylalanyl-tRNA synthetase alpha chain